MLRSQECPYLFSKRGVGRLVNAERLGDRAGNKRRVTDRRQSYEGYAIDKIRRDILDKLKRESRLTDTGRPGQGEQARAGAAKQLKRVGTLSLSPNQSGWGNVEACPQRHAPGEQRPAARYAVGPLGKARRSVTQTYRCAARHERRAPGRKSCARSDWHGPPVLPVRGLPPGDSA